METLREFTWLIPLLLTVSWLVILAFGTRMRGKGAEVGIATVGFCLAYSIVIFLGQWNGGPERVLEKSWQISTVGTIDGNPLAVEFGVLVDGLSAMMLVVVCLVSLMVHVYSVGYMAGEARYTFFFATLSLFTASMILLVLSPNLLQLIVGWEGVGVCSYLLIGHYWEQKENSNAAMKAFITTRIGDIGFMIGIFILTVTAGTFSIHGILEQVELGEISQVVATAGALCLFCGAIGKSAQFPLHVWLPDAMAGPTPVSALIHAATMVVAGVYLVARMLPVFEFGATENDPSAAMRWVATIGVITIVIAGLLALVQDDIKRVLAYSTVSQLGYMIAALGAGAFTAGMFHLFTHAFFKALLFLGSGSVIHAVHSNNMSDMGGLKKYLPRTYWTFLIGSLALAGVPPLAGFFSKDEILTGTADEGFAWVAVAGTIAAGLTAFYTFRMVYLTFHGTYKGGAAAMHPGHEAHVLRHEREEPDKEETEVIAAAAAPDHDAHAGVPHESPPVMTWPLLVLAFLTVTAGWLGIGHVIDVFPRTVDTEFALAHVPEHYPWESPWLYAGIAAALLGIGLAAWLFLRDAPTQAERDKFRIPVLYPVLENKYYLDDFYLKGVIGPIKGPLARATYWTNQNVIDGLVNGAGRFAMSLGRFTYGTLDQRGVDGVYNGVAATAGYTGGLLRYMQSGRVQQYALVLFGAVAVVIAALVIWA